MKELNERQQLAVALLASGVRNKDVAEQLGIARVTLAAWLQQPAFKYAIDIERARAIDAIQARLLQVADKAIQTLVAVLDDPTQPGAARVAAARVVLGRVLDSRQPAPEPLPPTESVMSDTDIMAACLRSAREGKSTAAH